MISHLKPVALVSVDAEDDGVAAAESVHATGFLSLRWWKSNI